MNRRIVAALAVAAALAAGTPAAADPPDSARFKGGCRFMTVADPNAPDTWTGEIDAVGYAYSVWHEHAPATVTRLLCEIRVNGVPAYSVEAPGTGPVVVIPPTPISFHARFDDLVEMCDTVEIVDAHGQAKAWTHCFGDPGWPLVPPEVRDAFAYYVAPHTCPAGLGCTPEGAVDNAVDTAYGIVDPPVCAALAAHARDDGTVRIDETGDLYVGGFPWWDCPPYEA